MLAQLNLPLHTISIIGLTVITLVVAFYSGMTIYSLLHFGRSRIIGLGASIIYLVLALALFAHALATVIAI